MKKAMKKLMAALLAVAMVCAMAIPAWAASGSSSATIICKRRCYHGANHSNCQQRSHEFLHCFFHGKSPFLFCPLPPPCVLHRG